MAFEAEIVKGDSLYEKIIELVCEYKPEKILEVGSGNGMGSTQAFIEGICKAGIHNKTSLYCLEANPQNYKGLIAATSRHPFVTRYDMCSVSIAEYMDEEDINHFMKSHGYMLNIKRHSEYTVNKWRNDELQMLSKNEIKENGIDHIKQKNGIKKFDMVLLDGSAFCGVADAKKVDNADVIIMDDSLDIKNLYAFREIAKECQHEIIYSNPEYRNGCLVLARRDIPICE